MMRGAEDVFTDRDCLNGCYDLRYGEPEDTLKVCNCLPADVLRAVDRFNRLGISVVFAP